MRVPWKGRSSVWELCRSLRQTAAVVSWFAGDHAAAAVWLAKWNRVPSILIAGGGDVANLPDMQYGAMAGTWKTRFVTRYAVRGADLVLPFSEFSQQEVLRIGKPRRMEILPLGVDTDWFKPWGAKGNTVATVANISRSNLVRKGLDVFVEAARGVPKARFVLAGRWLDETADRLRAQGPHNLEVPGFLSDDDLLSLFRDAKVYVQVSAHEGFGLALAEAMSCECIPVATDRGSLPEVVGDTGYRVPYGDAEATVRAIRTALDAPETAGSAARRRIIERFPIRRRADRLLALVADLQRGRAK